MNQCTPGSPGHITLFSLFRVFAQMGGGIQDPRSRATPGPESSRPLQTF